MSNHHLSALPLDPYQWRESVLSTRSLSYLSTADALGSPGFPPSSLTHSRNVSAAHFRQPSRKSTMMSEDSDYMELAVPNREREMSDIPELPDSVANSPLFNLPREIRDRIYMFCLTSQSSLPVEWPSNLKMGHRMIPKLLRTCRIIYEEASPVLYTSNCLAFQHPSDANMFVRAISSPLHGQRITQLHLQIRAQDTRLWMPYITSTDPCRSLKADFPCLRDLSVRFRSNKWQHALPPDANMRLWSEDTRLDEVIDGLRHVYLPKVPKSKELPELSEKEFQRYLEGNADIEGDLDFKKKLLALHKARIEYAAAFSEAPRIKVVCACKIHPTHFAALTTNAPIPVGPPQQLPVAQVAPAPVVAQQPLANVQGAQQPPADPVREGDIFRGFTAVDLKNGVKTLHNPELGIANIARTPYASKNGILLALEVHS